MDKKLLIFLLIFFLGYALYYRFILVPLEKNRPKPPAATTTAPSQAKQAPLQSQPLVEQPAQTVATPPVPAPVVSENQKLAQSVIDTPLYRAEFTNRGASLRSFRLKRYTDDYDKPLEMVPQSPIIRQLPLSLEFGDPQLTKLANEVLYSPDKEFVTLGEQEAVSLNFSYSDGQHQFVKTFDFRGDTYLVNCRVEAMSGSARLPVRFSWAPGLETLKSYKKAEFMHPSRGIVNAGQEVTHKESKSIKDFQKVGSTVKWAGVENNYFIATMIPQNQPADAYMQPAPGGEDPKFHNVDMMITPQRSEPFHVRLFVGPKDYYLLKRLGMNLEDAVDFGFFGPIAKGLFITLHLFYEYTNNYGWAIVLLTILVKIIFTPFTQKSFSSMGKMQQMQPELKKIQARYAKIKNDDPRKQNMNAEIMQLHKRYGVNPLGGCLPMLLQMPVLFAFYSLLSNAIEMRKAVFGLWIYDLSRPDPYYITPILMGATMLLQQRMTPASDPMQQKMMYIMPIMFTYISFNLQSGLVMYWLLSNVLSIAHQYYFQRQQKAAAPAVKDKDDKP